VKEKRGMIKMAKKKKLMECHRCEKKVPFEDIMLLGCKQCGGSNGSSSYGLLEAKYARKTKRLNGVIQ